MVNYVWYLISIRFTHGFVNRNSNPLYPYVIWFRVRYIHVFDIDSNIRVAREKYCNASYITCVICYICTSDFIIANMI